MESQIEASNKLIRTLEEKDNMVGINVKNMEQELQLRQQVQRQIFLGGKLLFFCLSAVIRVILGIGIA